ncbi:hypothetical protein C5167_037541 [Papaver somniferum]|uniref:Uncharacterized protein n=1 Tax=Papaver somniferum TaxID=3469 RepID=A0A4Y7IAZ7_PAPSO|nr:hypothetical protein C5167_037541 [Papaver somniferum]
MFDEMCQLVEEKIKKLESLYMDSFELSNDYEDEMELENSISIGGYENQEVAQKIFDNLSPPKFDSFSSCGEGEIDNDVSYMVFDKMSPPKFDSFLNFKEGEIVNDVYFDPTSPPIFDEEPNEEMEEDFITGYQIQRLGFINKYSMVELNDDD